MNQGTSLVVCWLKLCLLNAGGTGSIPGRGTKVLHARVYNQNNTFLKCGQSMVENAAPQDG